MAKYVVTGGFPLRGQVQIFGAKNAGFKAMIAALLCDSPSKINNLSRVGDIETTREVITFLGGKVFFLDDHTAKVDPAGLKRYQAPMDCGAKSRAGMMFAGPLLSRFGKAVLPRPGGDKIGVRPVDRHLAGLAALGVKIAVRDGLFVLSAPKGLHGSRFRFPKNSHTGTETLIMAAVKALGRTVLENAAAEPEVDNLIAFLNRAGARIKRVRPRTIVIEGVSRMRGITHLVMADRNAAVTFACAALATRGEVLVKGADAKVLQAFLKKVREAGGATEIQEDGINFYREKPLKATGIVTAPYPGFMTDWQTLWTVLMTQAQGQSTVWETVFENRFGYAPILADMGAKITLFNPKIRDPEEVYNFDLADDSPDFWHGAKISGPTKLFGRTVTVNDVRTGAMMLLAGLISQGETTVLDTKNQISRGYVNLASDLASLGAKIKVTKEAESSVIFKTAQVKALETQN